ncbi:MAG: hypothetical protein GY906_07120 [bacterium]|nr:hypothetical protein [bacterium]
MMHLRVILTLVIALSVMTPSAAEQPATASFLGQSLPGAEPVVFAPDTVSLPDSHELNSAFSADGRLFLFTRRVGEALKIFECRLTDEGRWTDPEMVSFSRTNTEWDEVDMWFTAGNRELLYISNVPVPQFNAGSVNIWRVDQKGGNWGSPTMLGAPVNSDGHEIYPMPVANGDLYFSSTRDGGMGGRDIYKATAIDGGYDNPVNLGSTINSEDSEGDIYVAPDESYMIVTSNREGGLGRADLYISYRAADGTWGELRNLGAPINSVESDYCPVVSPDGQYFFFSRSGDIYWMNAAALSQREAN